MQHHLWFAQRIELSVHTQISHRSSQSLADNKCARSRKTFEDRASTAASTELF